MTRLLCTLASLLLAAPATAQVWVAPRRPGQSAVQYDAHDWKTIDLLVGEQIEGEEAGGVRLLFYEDEREAAERAAAQIVDAYTRLSDEFDYVPEHRFPYVLYNSYAEFLRTNLFPLQEGVLGVTSTQSLELTLPYFGDHRLFSEVGTHEMAHEFTIQKVRSAADHAGVGRDPLPYLPLWFVEGLAEYYAQGGLSGRNMMLVRDVVTNPDLYIGHGMLGFYDDYPWSVLWTYQVGTARVTFLEEEYGEGTLQALLEASPWLVGGSSAFAVSGRRFSRLVEKVTGDDAHTVDAKFDAWIKRQTYEDWLESEQSTADFEPIEPIRGHITAFDSSSDGRIVAYRSIEGETGRSRLFVAPTDNPRRTRRVAAEGVPGAESLHPIDPRNFDVEGDRLAWVAESRGSDALMITELELVVREVEPPRDEDAAETVEALREARPPIESDDPWAVTDWAMQASAVEDLPDASPVVRVELGDERRYRMRKHDVVAIYSPSIGPDGRVAFVGLHEDGQKDVFVFTPEGRRGHLVRLTDDAYAERTLTWHGDRIVYSSDATSHGMFNLFAVAPTGGLPERLTTAAHDHVSPVSLPGGRLVFVGWEDDKANLYELVDGGIQKRTDFAIGLAEPAPGPDGGLMSLMQHQGRRTPVKIERDALIDGPVEEQEEGAPPERLPERELDEANDYKALAPRNWRPENLFGIVAAGPGGLYGQVSASATDLLRDRALVFSGFFFGSIELTDGYLLYLDQSRRLTWGGGPFQSLRFRLDRDLHEDLIFQSGERFYGGMLSARYPIDRFMYLQLDQAIGATSYFLYPDGMDEVLRDGDFNGTGQNLLDDWNETWAGIRPQTETTVRFGVDTVRYHYKTGPLAGASLLLEGTGGVQPFHDEVYASVRADTQAYVPVPLGSGANLGFKASGGTSGGGVVARSFFLSSYDTLRGAYYGDPNVLLGRHFYFASSELQVPLDAIIRVAIASTLEGVAAVDFGGVADEYDELWENRVFDVVLGGNVVLGPMVFRVHFAKAIDIGAELPVPEDSNQWVPNLSLTWLQM